MKNSRKLIFTTTIALFLFAIILILVLLNTAQTFDTSINSVVQTIQSPVLIKSSAIIGLIFDTKFLIIIILILALYHWIKKSEKDAMFAIVTISFGASMVYILKEIIQRARPLNILIAETGFAFPSGHATISLIFFGIITYLIFKNRKSKTLKQTTLILSILAILIIGLSRLIINAHWFTDILGGFALGAFILTICILFRKKLS